MAGLGLGVVFSISAFSRLSGLSPKSLRYYHDRGLLIPAYVDEYTGYRGYTLSQLEDAVTIRVLRAGGMPSERISEILASPDRAARLIDDYRDEVRRRYQQQDDALAVATGARSGVAERIELRDLPAQPYAALAVDLGPTDEAEAHRIEDVNGRVDEAGERLGQRLAEAGIQVTGPFWTGMAVAGEALRIAIQAPIDAADERVLPDDIWFGTLPERRESTVSVPLPERDGDESIQLALSTLLAESEYGSPDIRTLRQTVLTEQGRVEFAVTLLGADR